MDFSPRIIVQGGGYGRVLLGNKEDNIKATKEDNIKAAKESARAGYDILIKGGSAVDAVEAAVRVLEENEYFNAGRASLLNIDGIVECDAMIMEGHTLNMGAVISGCHYRNPVSLAKKIMDVSPHCALSGDGALKFARDNNFDTIDPNELISQQARARVHEEQGQEYERLAREGKPVEESQDTHGAVSAVALDVYGHLACAISTGGVGGKHEGRVGDVPRVGCGGYANEIGAAAATGLGEDIIRMTLAREVVYNMENGQLAQASAEIAMRRMKKRVEGNCGIIALDTKGNFGMTFNINMMAWARIKDNTLESGMEHNEVQTEQLPFE